MFYGDVASNIRMYDDTITDDQIIKAAEFVGADGFINDLDGQYHARNYQEGSSGFSAQRKTS